MYFNLKKLCIKAVSLSIASVMSVFSVVSANCFESKNSKVLSDFDIKTEAIKKLKTCIKVGTAVGIPFLSLVGISTLANESDVSKLKYKQKECFDTLTNKYTKKQEGITWCWIACLQAIFKYHGIEISQKDIHREIFTFNIIPPFKVLRNNTFPVDGVGTPQIYASSIDCKLRYNKAKVYITSDSKVNNLKNAILDYYNSTGKSIFAISDIIWSYALLSNRWHFVNVVEIDSDSNKIVIEDPTTGLSYTDDLDNFCEKRIKQYSKCSNFKMFTIVPIESDLSNNTYYFVNSNSYTKQSC